MSLENIIGKMKKAAAIGAFAGAFIFSAPSKAKAAEDDLWDFYSKISLGYEQNFIQSVSNIPLEIRDVPIHKNDHHVDPANAGPIEDGIDLYDRLRLGADMGTSLSVSDRTHLNFGLGLDFDLDTSFNYGWEYGWFDGRKGLKERNYTNAPGTDKRGGDAALTYMTAHPSYGPDLNSFLRPSLFVELTRDINSDVQLSVGSSFFYERLVAENGWDRNDDIETHDRYCLAEYIVATPHVGVKFFKDGGYIGGDLGITLPLTEKLNYGVEVDKSLGVWGCLTISFTDKE